MCLNNWVETQFFIRLEIFQPNVVRLGWKIPQPMHTAINQK